MGENCKILLKVRKLSNASQINLQHIPYKDQRYLFRTRSAEIPGLFCH